MELKGRAAAGNGFYGESYGPPKIVVVGCGGAGSNTISRLYKMGLSGAQTIALNTDKQHLSLVEADHKLLIRGVPYQGTWLRRKPGDWNEGC